MAFGIDDAVGVGLQIVNKFIPDPEQKAKAETELRSSLQQWDAQQTNINAIEAANPNFWVSGWRPFIGWIGGIGLAYRFLVVPTVYWYTTGNMPPPDGSLMELVFALLGIAGLRTYEKKIGVSK